MYLISLANTYNEHNQLLALFNVVKHVSELRMHCPSQIYHPSRYAFFFLVVVNDPEVAVAHCGNEVSHLSRRHVSLSRVLVLHNKAAVRARKLPSILENIVPAFV